ncbi:MAG TPA: non-homologous end-joining DNA ligase [Verrucomicrobiae bacterium]|jgi:bifunctional non-homologous end joining protein LigD|nr:non-homologous end-joining DNA ligase [Verrucomicrobiae bacterium]
MRTLKRSEDTKPLSARRGEQAAGGLRRIATDRADERQSNRTAALARGKKLAFVEPMKCQLRPNLPRDDGWVYEIKFDGIRVLAIKEGTDVKLFSRLGNDVTARFADIARDLLRLRAERAIIDGEVVALESSGKSSFQLLQMSRLPGVKPPPICYYVFDALRLDGVDLTGCPLHERKEKLAAALPEDGKLIRFSAGLKGDPQKLLEQIRARGLEGLVGKKPDSHYEPGRRSGAWIKIKVIQQQEFVIGGYTEPKGSREHFGALLVGYYRSGKLMFASKVGTGFDRALLKSLQAQFRRLTASDCPFANLPEPRAAGGGLTASEMRRCTWLQPKLVCEVVFNEWTRDGHLRQPVYSGLREDKRPEEVVRETKPS